MATIRKPTVAFGNGRFVNMVQHDNCVELKTRFQTKTGVLHATALLYHENEVFYMLGVVGLENTDAVERYEAEAFLNERDAAKAGMKFVMYIKSGG